MTDYLLRNTLNPGKVVKCTITFRQITNKGEEGEPVWLVEIGTIEPHKDGGSINPVYIHYTSSMNLDIAIREATEEIAYQVDWEPLDIDSRPPFVTYNYPNNGQQDVGIGEYLVVGIKELFPSAGVDLDSIQVTVNGFDVTEDVDISGDPYEYKLKWKPDIMVYDEY